MPILLTKVLLTVWEGEEAGVNGLVAAQAYKYTQDELLICRDQTLCGLKCIKMWQETYILQITFLVN